ncbi:MAG: sigma-70 family RNA polymerase sigma factor [Deltaproteobacteria bacterium]|nr:sigma-70 family RNA polymerase sigma factor [Deltaproteobacteria bacterium]
MPDDSELPDTLSKGVRSADPEALRSLVRKEAPKVAGLLVRLLGPRQDLEDLVQTVFLEVCRALPRFRGDSAASTFVGGITVQVARRAMKGTAWTRRRGTLPEVEPPSTEPGADRVLDARAQLTRLQAFLADVPPKKRVAFLLWAVEGHSAEEVAQLTESSLATARKRIYDVRRDLRDRARADPMLEVWVRDE